MEQDVNSVSSPDERQPEMPSPVRPIVAGWWTLPMFLLGLCLWALIGRVLFGFWS